MEIKTQTDALQEIHWLIPNQTEPGTAWHNVKIAVERGMAVAPVAPTPAQQRADELVELARQVVMYDRQFDKTESSVARHARLLLAQIEPPKAPTAEELAEALATVLRCDDAGAALYREHRADFTALVERARQTGLLK